MSSSVGRTVPVSQFMIEYRLSNVDHEHRLGGDAAPYFLPIGTEAKPAVAASSTDGLTHHQSDPPDSRPLLRLAMCQAVTWNRGVADDDPNLGEMPAPREPGPGRFPVTSWTAVVAVQREGDTAQAEEALSQLCQAYWNPLFAYVRRLGHSEQDAKDLTQQFFLELLSKNFLRAADRTKGKLRTFLLTALNHFLANEWDRANTLKRGGGKTVLSLEEEREREGGGFEPAVEASPLKIYERQWAGTLFERAHARLREELAATGKEDQYDLLKDFLGDRTSPGGYEDAAGKLKMSVGTVRVTVHRLRQQLAKLIRAEVADTLVNPTSQEIETELKHLFEAFDEV